MNPATLTWEPHLAAGWCGLLALALAAWAVWVYRRMLTRMPARRALLLGAPRAGVALLILAAVFDPVRSVTVRKAVERDLLVLTDESVSMDVADAAEPRAARAGRARERLRQAVPSALAVRMLGFDTALREPDAPRAGADGPRGTDIGACLLQLAERSDLSSYAAVVLLTDGGDEDVQTIAAPPCPLHVVGFGTDPAGWNDLSVVEVHYPPSAERGVDFEVQAVLRARAADPAFRAGVSAVEVVLETEVGGQWRSCGESRADLSNLRAGVTFRASVEEPGLRRFRVAVAERPGELSGLNNRRAFTVDVQRAALHVLFFTRELGAEFKTIRRDLASDPGVRLTALFRTTGEQFTLQGERLPGDEALEAGFPSDPGVLRLFDAIILGSFPAEDWTEPQTKALLAYVEEGGAAVFLGGEKSFGLGGYALGPLAVLFPWSLDDREPAMLRGEFPVSVPASAAAHPLVAGIAELLEAAARGEAGRREGRVESVNPAGALKPGAVILMVVSAGDRAMPLIAVQRFGQGRVMAIASNTLWKWAGAGAELARAHGLFWRQAVRNLGPASEGGRLLAVKWDSPSYRPGEEAAAELSVAGESGGEPPRFMASLESEGGSVQVPVDPVQGRPGVFVARMTFRRRGLHGFNLSAYRGDALLESYEKALSVAPLLDEGARLELDRPFLERLAARGGGLYVGEAEIDKLIEHLTERDLQKTLVQETSLIHGSPWFALLLVGLLAAEWTARRRANLF